MAEPRYRGYTGKNSDYLKRISNASKSYFKSYEDEEKKRQEDEAVEQARKAEEARNQPGPGLFDRAKGIVGGVASGMAEKYKDLSGGLAETLAEYTGVADQERAANERRQADNTRIALQAQEKLKDPNLSKKEKARWQRLYDSVQQDSKTSFQEQSDRTKEIIEKTDPMRGAANVAGIGADIVSFGKLGSGSGFFRQGAIGAGIEGAASIPRQYAEDKEITLKDTLTDVGAGFALGGLGGYAQDFLDARGARKAVDGITDNSRMLPERAGTGADVAPESRQLGMGPNDPNLGTISRDDPADLKRLDEIDQQFTKAQQDGNITAESARALNQERKVIQNRIQQKTLESIPEDASPTALAQTDPVVRKAVASEADKIDDAFAAVDDKYTPGLLGSFSTQERVFKKAGLGDVWEVVRDNFDNYTRARNAVSGQVRGWAERVGASKEASTKIFRYLDGRGGDLAPNEMAVAEEMKTWLSQMADDLGLPPEARITDYVPHLFDTGKKVDPELLRLVRKNSSGDVTSPFLQKRFGSTYKLKEDVFEALEAYGNKATRQLNMSEGLDLLQKSKKKVSEGMATFINDQMNLIKNVPDAQSDLLRKVDDTLSKVGIKPGTVARGSQIARNTIYRATLGLNFGSPLRNLSQISNTVGKTGKYAVPGYAMAVKNLVAGNIDELIEMNVLDDTLEKALRGVRAPGVRGGIKKTAQKADDVLWSMFDASEKLNRGAAYYAGKMQALGKGMTEAQARKAGAAMARKTQFKFSAIDTPQALQGDIAKNLTQFQSFNIKQVEFIKDMIVGSDGMFRKGANGRYTLSAQGTWALSRFIGTNLAFMATAGSLIGMEPEDFVPFWNDVVAEGKLPISPLVGIVTGDEKSLGLSNLVTGKDQYGNEKGRGELAKDFVVDEAIGLTLPGGSQIKKTIEGMDAANQGFSMTDGGQVRFPIDDSGEMFPGATDLRAGLFGQYSGPQAQEYFDRGGKPLSDKQSEIYLAAPEEDQEAVYETFTKLQGASTKKSEVADRVRSAAQAKEFQKAKRLAIEHNANIELLRVQLQDRLGEVPESIEDYLNTYKVSYDYYIDKYDE